MTMARATSHEIPSPMMAAGMRAMRGHTYGMNSMIPQISARENLFSITNGDILKVLRRRSVLSANSRI
jgi:hypothetical protein